MNEKPKLYCSFCGKSMDKVKKLIAGPTVFICNECVKLCMDMVNEIPFEEAEPDYQLQEKIDRIDRKLRAFSEEIRIDLEAIQTWSRANASKT